MAVTIEARMAQAAAGQHGVVTREQLIHSGLTDDGIRSHLRAGRLLPVHRGVVYMPGTLVGRLRPTCHREMAAVLACGRGAVISHRSALWLHALIPARPRGPVHLALEVGRCRRPGVAAHRVASLHAEDVGTVRGIPTTGVIRTILDVAADANPRKLEQIIARADRLGRLDIEALRDRVKREKGRPGLPLLRTILARPTRAFTRSAAEDGLLGLVREAHLPEPRCNDTVCGYELDLYWPDHGVAVEVDGFAHHASRRSFERDRDRDFALAAEGIEVLRVTWRQIHEGPLVVVRRLAAVLARAELLRERAAERAVAGERASGRGRGP